MPTRSKKLKPNNVCPLCGLTYVDHRGLIGTCAKLKAAMKALSDIAQSERTYGHRKEALMAIATINMMP